MLGALDVGLLDLDHHPPIRPSLAVLRQLGQHILGQLVGQGFELVALHDARLAIDMQADGIAIEVEDQQGDVRIFRNVPQTGKYAVAAVFGVEEMLVPQHMDEAGLAESRAAIAFAVTIGGADEHELLPGGELPHPRGEKIQDLPGIKGIGPILGGISRLQRLLAVVAGQEDRGFQLYRTNRLARRMANPGRRRITCWAVKQRCTMQVHICPTSNSLPKNRAAACDVGATNLTRNHPQRGPRMPSASSCANASTVSPLMRAGAIAKTIMVLRNIVGTPFGTRRRPFD